MVNKILKKKLSKKDLNKKELKYYNKLMEGINNISDEEKEEVAHLMEVFIEAEEEVFKTCVRCGVEFKGNIEKTIPKRIYCDDCLLKMWSPL